MALAAATHGGNSFFLEMRFWFPFKVGVICIATLGHYVLLGHSPRPIGKLGRNIKCRRFRNFSRLDHFRESPLRLQLVLVQQCVASTFRSPVR